MSEEKTNRALIKYVVARERAIESMMRENHEVYPLFYLAERYHGINEYARTKSGFNPNMTSGRGILSNIAVSLGIGALGMSLFPDNKIIAGISGVVATNAVGIYSWFKETEAVSEKMQRILEERNNRRERRDYARREAMIRRIPQVAESPEDLTTFVGRDLNYGM